MVNFVYPVNSEFIIRYYIDIISNLWNKRQFIQISFQLDQIKTNSFMNNKQKNSILQTYFCNIKLLNIIRKIRQHKNKQNNIPSNKDTILLDPVYMIKDLDVIDITFGNSGYFHRFNMYELIELFNNAVFSMAYGFPQCVIPKNPYTNIEFNIKEFYTIYQIIKNKNNNMPLAFTLLNLSYYDKNILYTKFYNILSEKAISKLILSYSPDKFYKKLKDMFNRLEIKSCMYCVKKISDHKVIFSNLLKRYIVLINQNSHDFKSLKIEINEILKENNILHFNIKQHIIKHRNIKSYKKKIKFNNHFMFKETETIPNFVFTSISTPESIKQFKKRKYHQKKRHINYQKRRNISKSNNQFHEIIVVNDEFADNDIFHGHDVAMAELRSPRFRIALRRMRHI